MRVIDTHTHFPGTAFGLRPRSAADLREEFEAQGLSGAWIMTTDGLLGEPERHNDLLADGMRDHLDFFIPFCSVNPHDGADRAIRELERAAGPLGMRGLKLHPWLQAFSLTHPAVTPILSRAGELGLPVLFHDGTPPYSTPLQIAWAAEQAPHTTIILGHAGLDDLYHDAVLACLRHPNVCLCLCSLSAGFIRDIIRKAPTDRLLFGSDGGFAAHLGRAAIAKLIATGASEETLQRIFYENPRRLLPLDAAS